VTLSLSIPHLFTGLKATRLTIGLAAALFLGPECRSAADRGPFISELIKERPQGFKNLPSNWRGGHVVFELGEIVKGRRPTGCSRIAAPTSGPPPRCIGPTSLGRTLTLVSNGFGHLIPTSKLSHLWVNARPIHPRAYPLYPK
jgi:hypothetical protein